MRAEGETLAAKRVRVLGRIVAEVLDAAGEPVTADLDARLRDRVREHPRRTGTGFHDEARWAMRDPHHPHPEAASTTARPSISARRASRASISWPR